MTTDPTTPADRQIPAWAPTVGAGWIALLNQLHEDLRLLDPEYRIERFGTSLGGLRVTVADRFQEGEFDGEFADQATALTDAAETASERTCETCGSPGRIRLRGDGLRTWMQSSCDACRTLPIRKTASPGTAEINPLGTSRP
ncbi:hypothetical protein OG864_00770 [Streptomyces sp. NBC_00124]|uniref:hypothetical protein n=1 Tax=Streptomyces sp. NBC_00124 TaxID=2975662 RepID=UPI002256B232|nr:hypothetical protein [Streptomyces sp. NBC_00124]MCX5357316.1 hypothetical protein [Streptomyces sp. NBC_00124]